MVRITIDDNLRQKLFSSGEIVELCDKSGRLLGRMVPQIEKPLEDNESLTPELSEQELQQRYEINGPTITTAELIERLKAQQ